MSRDLNQFLHERGVATSHSTPYHLTGNSQCVRLNQTLRKTIQLLLRTQKLDNDQWEAILPEALHAIRSLLCISTNNTPHERFLPFSRRSMFGQSLPSWLVNPGVVLIRKQNRNKNHPLCEKVELLHANPSYAYVKFADGRETTVSTSDLAPQASTPGKESESETLTDPQVTNEAVPAPTSLIPEQSNCSQVELSETDNEEPIALRRSTRIRKAVDRYGAVPYE